jgi:hypothetical protein
MIGRRHRDMASRAGLRFSPLEIFAQRQFQPIRSRIFRVRTGLSLALIAVVVHRGPARMRGCSDVISVRIHRRNVQIRGHDPSDRGAGWLWGSSGLRNREPDRPKIEPAEGVSGHPSPILVLLARVLGYPRACACEALVARIGRLVGAVSADSLNQGHAAVAQW